MNLRTITDDILIAELVRRKRIAVVDVAVVEYKNHEHIDKMFHALGRRIQEAGVARVYSATWGFGGTFRKAEVTVIKP
jgi:hypothetical protein